MFLHLSVSHSVHGGGYLGKYPLGRYTPWQVHPLAGTSPGQVHPPGRYTPMGRYTPWAGTLLWQVHPLAGIPPGQVHPPGRYTPLARYTPWVGTPPGRYPPKQCMLGYDQQAGGTYPTGMHSCYLKLLTQISECFRFHIELLNLNALKSMKCY